MFVAVVLQQKGGVGKSTIATNLAAQLAHRYGRSVMLIDGDPQGTATEATLGLQLPAAEFEGTAEVLGFGAYGGGERKTLSQVAIRSDAFGIDVVASHYGRMIHQETALASDRAEGHLALMDAFARADGAADFVIYDGPPNFGPFMVCGAVAADAVIVPLDSSGESYHALGLLMATFLKYQRIRGGPVPVIAGVMTVYNERAKEHREILLAVKQAKAPGQSESFFPEVVTVRMTTAFQRAFNEHKPLFADTRSKAEKKAVEEIDRLAKLVVDAEARTRESVAAV